MAGMFISMSVTTIAVILVGFPIAYSQYVLLPLILIQSLLTTYLFSLMHRMLRPTTFPSDMPPDQESLSKHANLSEATSVT